MYAPKLFVQHVDDSFLNNCVAGLVRTAAGFDGVNDFYRPTTSNADWIEWQVYTRWGQLVFSTTNLSDSWTGLHNGASVSPGVYFIEARCGS